MKKLGVLLIAAGTVCALCGLYGFILIGETTANSYGMSSSDVEAMLSLAKLLGAEANLSFWDQLQLLIMENRMLLLILGTAGAILGSCLKRKAEEMAYYERMRPSPPWKCTTCGAENPAGKGNCTNCGHVKEGRMRF